MKQIIIPLLAILAVTFSGESQAKIRKHNIENPQVKAFYDQVRYSDSDYSYSLIDRYRVRTHYRLDQPWPVEVNWESTVASENLRVVVKEVKPGNATVLDKTIDGHASSYFIWNLVPGRRYTYSVTDGSRVLTSGKFSTEGRRRMIYAPSVHNFRDLGGMKTTSGKTLKYGKLYRGGELVNLTGENREKVRIQVSEDDIRLMHDDLGIRGEIDFRFDGELGYADDIEGNEIKFTPLGDDVAYYNIQTHHAGQFGQDMRHGEIFKTVLHHLRKGEAVYLHCVAGADRTGLMCLLLEGVLGVPESDLMKDYELTSFSIYGPRRRNNGDMSHGLPMLKAYPGSTMQEKITNLFLSEGVTRQEIDEYTDLML
ncbi:MAG: tyrosine-protein phosphatase [Bacteroidales bacterium]|nr:tyrosine-protein phosphatase [Bacteroidales bacterium]